MQISKNSFETYDCAVVSLQRRLSSRPRRSPLRGPLAHRVVGAQLVCTIQQPTNYSQVSPILIPSLCGTTEILYTFVGVKFMGVKFMRVKFMGVKFRVTQFRG